MHRECQHAPGRVGFERARGTETESSRGMKLPSTRAPLLFLTFVAMLSAATALADPPPDQVASYTILRNGSAIGSQAVRFQTLGDRLIIQYRVRISVDVDPM